MKRCWSFVKATLKMAFLRVWEPEKLLCLVGYSNKIVVGSPMLLHARAKVTYTQTFQRRGTVLQGPGCLNYSLAVNNQRMGIPADLTVSYRFVLARHMKLCLSDPSEAVQIQGISDLALDGRKFSGNAQHRTRLLQPVSWNVFAAFRHTAYRRYLRIAVEAA